MNDMYLRAAIRHEQAALTQLDRSREADNEPDATAHRNMARIHARLALRLQDEAAYTGDVIADRLARYVG